MKSEYCLNTISMSTVPPPNIVFDTEKYEAYIVHVWHKYHVHECQDIPASSKTPVWSNISKEISIMKNENIPS